MLTEEVLETKLRRGSETAEAGAPMVPVWGCCALAGPARPALLRAEPSPTASPAGQHVPRARDPFTHHHQQRQGLPCQTLTTKSGSVSQSSPCASAFTDTSCPTTAFHICTRRTRNHPEPAALLVSVPPTARATPKQLFLSPSASSRKYTPCFSADECQHPAPGPAFPAHTSCPCCRDCALL